jgi:serine/threonine protein phosphatase PrpC
MQFKRGANGEVYGFFGVFDGHGGATAANFVKENLFINLQKHEKFPNDMEAALSMPLHICLCATTSDRLCIATRTSVG